MGSLVSKELRRFVDSTSGHQHRQCIALCAASHVGGGVVEWGLIVIRGGWSTELPQPTTSDVCRNIYIVKHGHMWGRTQQTQAETSNRPSLFICAAAAPVGHSSQFTTLETVDTQ